APRSVSKRFSTRSSRSLRLGQSTSRWSPVWRTFRNVLRRVDPCAQARWREWRIGPGRWGRGNTGNHRDSLRERAAALVVADLLAAGGTAAAAGELSNVRASRSPRWAPRFFGGATSS